MLAISSGVVVVESLDGVGWIKLNRPSQINAINDAMRTEVPQALRDFDADADVKVVVISGEGTRGFCAGADIKETRGAETAAEVRSRMIRSAWIETIDQISKPVICAIHGACMGGGLELALSCDIRIASKDAVFALPEVGLGLIPGGGGTQRLARVVGLGRALDLVLTGERIDADEAYRIGLVSRLSASQEELEVDARQLANRIARTPPAACSLARDAVRNSLDLDLAQGLKRERDLFSVVMTTEDRLEAALAFREKRPPQFNGR